MNNTAKKSPLAPTAQPALDALRPAFELWWAAKTVSPDVRALWRANSSDASKHLCWQALVELGNVLPQPSPGTPPPAGLSPCPGATSAVAGASPAAGGKARASLPRNAEGGTGNAEKEPELVVGHLARHFIY